MTRSTVVQLRTLSLLTAALVLAGGAMWGHDLGRSAAVAHRHAGPVVDEPSAIVVSIVAEAKSTSGWVTPLAALGAALALAIGYFGPRDSSAERASYAVKQRLVHAGRRAPPMRVLRTF